MPTLRPGSQMCFCATCGRYFSGLTGFDLHRIGNHDVSRRCMTDKELRAKGYITRNDVWGRDAPRPAHLNTRYAQDADRP